MSQLTSVPKLVAQGFDRNQDQWVHDDLTVPNDPSLIMALGGDRQVSVDELARAIEGDRVVIRNRKIEPVGGPIEVPNLFADAESVHPYAKEAVRMTDRFPGDLVVPPMPLRANFKDDASYQAALTSFHQRVDNFERSVKGERYLLLGAIQNVLMRAKDPEIKGILHMAMAKVVINDLDDYFKAVRQGKASGEVYAKDRDVMRQGLVEVARLTDFTPPRLAIQRLNGSLSLADMAVSQEKRIVTEHREAYIRAAEAKLKELEEQGGPINWLAAQRLKAKLQQAKAADPTQLSLRLNQIARLAYEATVAAWGMGSRDDARVLSHDSRTFSGQADEIEKQARQEVRAIEGLR